MISLATTKDTYSLNAFSDCYDGHHQLMEEGRLVLIEGQVLRRQDDEVQLAANSLRPLDQALDKLIDGITFLIESNGDASSFVQLLRRELEISTGRIPVRIGVQIEDNQAVVADMASSLEWSFNKDQFQSFQKHPALRGTLLKLPQIKAPPPRWKKNKRS